jgi:hypothetical protein
MMTIVKTDRDIDHLTGHSSVRSLVVQHERLTLFMWLMNQLERIELNGTIDFDVQH